MLYDELQIIGQECQNHRRRINIRQEQVGDEIGYSKQTISQFENGHNNNLYIFAWYLMNGLNTDRLKNKIRGCKYGKET